MKNIENIYNGEFNAHCQQNSAPIELLTLIDKFIEESDISTSISQPVLTRAQFIMYVVHS